MPATPSAAEIASAAAALAAVVVAPVLIAMFIGSIVDSQSRRKSVSREPRVENIVCRDPDAWGVAWIDEGDRYDQYLLEAEAKAICEMLNRNGELFRVVPLYRHVTLSAAERHALEFVVAKWFIASNLDRDALRGLLERSGAA